MKTIKDFTGHLKAYNLRIVLTRMGIHSALTPRFRAYLKANGIEKFHDSL